MDKDHLNIDNLDGYQFEELVAKIMKKAGYENIKVTSKSNDMGKDIVMDAKDGDKVIVECKHQKFVGRPVLQKLQGAINHEEKLRPGRNVRGIVVTSGRFSPGAIKYIKEIGHDLELIDGRKLKELCKQLDVYILNGKVQIITNDAFETISEKDAKDITLKGYSKIYGNKALKPVVNPDLRYIPVCFINYHVGFNTYTSIGCVDTYSKAGKIILEGIGGQNVEENISNFYFNSNVKKTEIPKKDRNKKKPFEFTENDIENYAIDHITDEHTHEVAYYGRNNVRYVKRCVPKKRDIDIKTFLPIFLPGWKNNVKILKMKYEQVFFSKGNKKHYMDDDLKKCKVCEKIKEKYEDMSLCPECGRIVCKKHVKIDYLDKKTPICTLHVKKHRVFLQKKNFATTKNLKEYKKYLESRNFFQKCYEDDFILGITIWVVLSFIIYILYRFIG